MSVHTVRLSNGAWEYDDEQPLAPPGGFGQVFRGSGATGPVAVKRLHLSAGAAAHRELVIGDRLKSREFRNVVPVLDAGQDAETERYYLVMPICDESLQQYIARQGTLTYPDLRAAILDVVNGLREVGELVHRDLKPANILRQGERWLVADFGIAKFVEDSTSLETLRESLTPAYAAPEQWRNERPTSATDVYALGCIVHALATGCPPFRGDVDEMRVGHLEGQASVLGDLPPRIGGLVATMLRKPPQSRPTLARVAAVFGEVTDAVMARPSLAALAEAGRGVATAQAEAEARALAMRARQAERKELAKVAIDDLRRIIGRLQNDVVAQSSDSAEIRGSNLLFGNALLQLKNEPRQFGDEWLEENRLANCRWKVVAWATLELTQRTDLGRHYVWGCSLLYADRDDGAGYRWYEVSFFRPWEGPSSRSEPYAIEAYDSDLDLALSRLTHTVAAAFGPVPIDAEDEDDFVDRWSHLIAKAALGRLDRPPMPIHRSYFTA